MALSVALSSQMMLKLRGAVFLLTTLRSVMGVQVALAADTSKCFSAVYSGFFTARTSACNATDPAQQWTWNQETKTLVNAHQLHISDVWGMLTLSTNSAEATTIEYNPATKTLMMSEATGKRCFYSSMSCTTSGYPAPPGCVVILKSDKELLGNPSGKCGDDSSKWVFM